MVSFMLIVACFFGILLGCTFAYAVTMYLVSCSNNAGDSTSSFHDFVPKGLSITFAEQKGTPFKR